MNMLFGRPKMSILLCLNYAIYGSCRATAVPMDSLLEQIDHDMHQKVRNGELTYMLRFTQFMVITWLLLAIILL
jgi:hypothetical protein